MGEHDKPFRKSKVFGWIVWSWYSVPPGLGCLIGMKVSPDLFDLLSPDEGFVLVELLPLFFGLVSAFSNASPHFPGKEVVGLGSDSNSVSFPYSDSSPASFSSPGGCSK